jgi:hypothetical protein
VHIFFDCVFTGWPEMSRSKKPSKGLKKEPKKGSEDPKNRKKGEKKLGSPKR